MDETYSTYGGEEMRIHVLVKKSEEKRPLGRPRRRWEDNIEKDPGGGLGVWTGLICLRKRTRTGLL
jgi:hypothetical protein